MPQQPSTTAAAQNTAQAVDLMAPITVVHLVLIAALALAAILVIWWGTVLRRRRIAAEQQVAENFEIAEEHGATTEPAISVNDGDTPAVSADVPAPQPTSAAAAAAPGETAIATDLTQIKGLGPKLAALLTERGITRVDQLAALSPSEAATLDAQLGSFQGRMARDRWIEQAKLLAAGDRAGYEAAFGKLGG